MALARHHFPLLFKWLNKAHVQEWFSRTTRPISLEGIEKKLGPRIDGDELVHCYIISVDKKEIGYIQWYNARHFPREGYNLEDITTQVESIPLLIAIDLYIGDKEFMGKGYGSKIINQFLHSVVKKYDACLVDPETTNLSAIICYKKAGFESVAQLTLKDHSVNIMIKRW